MPDSPLEPLSGQVDIHLRKSGSFQSELCIKSSVVFGENTTFATPDTNFFVNSFQSFLRSHGKPQVEVGKFALVIAFSLS